MRIVKAVLDAINIIHEDSNWVQLLDLNMFPSDAISAMSIDTYSMTVPATNPARMQRMKLKMPKVSKDRVKNDVKAKNLWDTVLKSKPLL